MMTEDLIEYPRGTDGKILTRRAETQLRRLPEIPAEQPGGLDWTFKQMFGGIEEGIRMVESLVAGQGPKADRRWALMLLAYRSQVEMAEGLGKPAPSLNSIAAALDIPVPEFLSSIVTALQQLNVALAQAKILQAASGLTEVAIMAAYDPIEGQKDRQMLLEAAGVVPGKGGGGVNVQVNQQVGVSVKAQAEELKAPLRQFRKEMTELDDLARDNAVEGEVVNDN